MTDATTPTARVQIPLRDLQPIRDLAADMVSRASRTKSLIYTGFITAEGLVQAQADALAAARAALALHAMLEAAANG